MSFCSYCGKKLDDGAAFCSGCGRPIGQQSGAQFTDTSGQQGDGNQFNQPVGQGGNQYNQNNQQVNPDDCGGFWWGVCGFCGALVTFIIPLVMFCVWQKQYPQRSKSIMIGMIVGIIVQVIVSYVLSVFFAQYFSDIFNWIFDRYTGGRVGV